MNVLPGSASVTAVDAAPVDDVRPIAFGRLAVAALGLFVFIAAAVNIAVLLVQHVTGYPYDTYDGWQFDVTAGVLAALALAVGVVALWELRRLRCDRGRSGKRRAVVAAVLLPGFALGGLTWMPMQTALTWASNHTAAAAAARSQARAWQANYRKAPLAMPSGHDAASAEFADRMLRPSDFGAGWYDALQPNPTALPVTSSMAALGVTYEAESSLTKAHWAGDHWVLDEFTTEHVFTLGSLAAARVYANHVSGTAAPPGLSVGVFVEADDVFVLRVYTGSARALPEAEFDRMLAVASRRATT